ncbi:MAG: hypothetical protein ACK2T0_00995 [Anaerolineales bacterium]
MSRIVNSQSTGRERAQLVRAIVVAIRELSRQSSFGEEARDLASFIVLALQTVLKGVDASAKAWEKRGYWVKADRFRMDWDWAEPLAAQLRSAIESADEPLVASLVMRIAQRLSGVQVSSNPRVGKPWIGAFARLRSDS